MFRHACELGAAPFLFPERYFTTGLRRAPSTIVLSALGRIVQADREVDLKGCREDPMLLRKHPSYAGDDARAWNPA
jgi:hypothetical protein